PHTRPVRGKRGRSRNDGGEPRERCRGRKRITVDLLRFSPASISEPAPPNLNTRLALVEIVGAMKLACQPRNPRKECPWERTSIPTSGEKSELPRKTDSMPITR